MVVCWCSDDVTVKGTLDLPFTAATAVDFPPIPTSSWPSDHLALGCHIEF